MVRACWVVEILCVKGRGRASFPAGRHVGPGTSLAEPAISVDQSKFIVCKARVVQKVAFILTCQVSVLVGGVFRRSCFWWFGQFMVLVLLPQLALGRVSPSGSSRQQPRYYSVEGFFPFLMPPVGGSGLESHLLCASHWVRALGLFLALTKFQ